MTCSQIMKVHESSGHRGIRCTVYFAWRVCLTITKADVRCIRACEQYQTINPAVKANWQRLGIAITHYNGKHFLTVTYCGPARFTIWRPLPRQDPGNIIQHLEAIFSERGPQQELLVDNDTAFFSGEFRKFSTSWGVSLRFRCAYVPAGNGIIERCHRSIKRIAARTRCSVQEAVYWYNVVPKDDTSSLTAPANGIYRYEVRIRNIDPVSTSPVPSGRPCMGPTASLSMHVQVSKRNSNRGDQPANRYCQRRPALCEGRATSDKYHPV